MRPWAEPISDEETPQVTPSPAKGAFGFPFPGSSDQRAPGVLASRLRQPSALLGHRAPSSMARRQRLMARGIRTPDRFIPQRSSTSMRDALVLSRRVPKLHGLRSAANERHGLSSDPFGSAARRTLRMAEQYATVRHPAAQPRTIGLRSSRVDDSQSQDRRAASVGSIWTVGGTIVTEGVASVTNGRGGRITSGTNAPHYSADFLRRHSQSEEEITHSRRLAVAMDIDQNARILELSSPASTPSSSPSHTDEHLRRVWRDGAWQKDARNVKRKVTNSGSTMQKGSRC